MPDPNNQAEREQLLQFIRASYLNGTATPEQARAALVDYYVRFGASPEEAQALTASTLTSWGRPGQTTGGGVYTGGKGEGLPSDKAFWSTVDFPEVDPQAAWQRGLRLPATGQNPFQQWLAGQATPAFAGWGAEAAARPLGITPMPGQGGQQGPSAFSNFIGQSGGQMGQSAAYNVLNRLRGMGSEPQQNWLNTIGATGGPGLKDVLESAMRGKGYAGFVSRAMANRLPALQTGWSAETEGGAQPGQTLLDYLLQNLGF